MWWTANLTFLSLLVATGFGGGCDICGSGGSEKPTSLTFRYTTSAANSNQQGDYAGFDSGSYPSQGYLEFSDGDVYSVSDGQKFTATPSGGKFDSDCVVEVQNTDLEFYFHTSCSYPLVTGDRYGPLTLLGGGSCPVEDNPSDGGGGMFSGDTGSSVALGLAAFAGVMAAGVVGFSVLSSRNKQPPFVPLVGPPIIAGGGTANYGATPVVVASGPPPNQFGPATMIVSNPPQHQHFGAVPIMMPNQPPRQHFGAVPVMVPNPPPRQHFGAVPVMVPNQPPRQHFGAVPVMVPAGQIPSRTVHSNQPPLQGPTRTLEQQPPQPAQGRVCHIVAPPCRYDNV